jgi:tetratricopeptide (TPR) repeat protein
LSIINNHSFAWNLYHARRYNDALQQIQHVAELDPQFGPTQAVRSRIFEKLGRYREAAENTAAGTLWGTRPEYRAMLVKAAETGGAKGYWEAQLAVSRRALRDAHRRSDVWLAYIFTGLGERDSAFAALERAYAAKEGDLLFVKVDPLLDPLRGDPRMKDLLGRMGLAR